MAVAVELIERVETVATRHPRSPLRVAGTALPPSWLAAAKGITFLLFALRYHETLGAPFAPVLGVLGGVPGDAWGLLLQVMAGAGAALLFSNAAVRLGAGLVGWAFLLEMAGDAADYQNAVVWSACVLVVVSLYTGEAGFTVLRWQFAALYTGASLNKLLDPDWLDGTFMRAWAFDGAPAYARAVELFGPGFHSLTGWTVIAVEAILAVLVVRRSTRTAAVAIGLCFHSIPFVLAGNTFGIFYPALALSMTALFDPRPAGPPRLRDRWRDPHVHLVLALAWGTAHLAKNTLL